MAIEVYVVQGSRSQKEKRVYSAHGVAPISRSPEKGRPDSFWENRFRSIKDYAQYVKGAPALQKFPSLEAMDKHGKENRLPLLRQFVKRLRKHLANHNKLSKDSEDYEQIVAHVLSGGFQKLPKGYA